MQEEDNMKMVVIAISDDDMTFMLGNEREMMIMYLDGEFVTMVAGDKYFMYIGQELPPSIVSILITIHDTYH